MKQSELLDIVRDWINGNIPESWNGLTVPAVACYSHVQVMADEEDRAVIVILPESIAWSRRDRGRARREHDISVVILGKQKDDATVKVLQDGLEELAEQLMQSPIAGADTLGVVTVGAAKAGYVREALRRDAQPYLGGILVTFWVN